MASGYSQATLQIDSGESLSDESIQLNSANIRDYSKLGTRVATSVPADWTAANVTFQASNDDTTFTNLYDTSGNEITVTMGALA